MLRNVFSKTLLDHRRALLFWGIGLIAYALYDTLFYPSISNVPELNRLLEEMPEALIRTLLGGQIVDFTSPVGFFNTQLFFLMMPVLFLIFAIGFGSNAIAGEEERGTLDLLLSNPLPRWRVVVEKFAALVVSTMVLAIIFWLGLTIGVIAVDIDISLGRMAEATLSVVLLGLVFGTLALAVGCARGNRGLSIGVAGGLGVAAYLLNSLGGLVEVLEPYRILSPFYHHSGNDPLANGLSLGHVGVLIGLTVVLLAVALITFERRDLAV